MTPDEIKEIPSDGRTASGWMKEVAYQLALLNEQLAAKPVPPIVVKRK